MVEATIHHMNMVQGWGEGEEAGRGGEGEQMSISSAQSCKNMVEQMGERNMIEEGYAFYINMPCTA